MKRDILLLVIIRGMHHTKTTIIYPSQGITSYHNHKCSSPQNAEQSNAKDSKATHPA